MRLRPATIAALLFALLVPACDDAPPPLAVDPFVGTWEADLRPVFEAYCAGEDDPDAAVEAALAGAHWRWYVQPGGRIVQRQQLTAREQVSAGTWVMLSREGDACQLQLSFETGGVAFTEAPLFFDGDDRFTVHLSDESTGAEESYTFHRRR